MFLFVIILICRKSNLFCPAFSQFGLNYVVTKLPKKEKKRKERKVLSLRNALMLSVALNVGLFLRLGYVGESWRAE